MSSIPVLSVKRQSFTTRIPTDSVVGTVGAEEVKFQVDDTWVGLQVFAVFSNAAMPEQAPVTILLDETMTCAIPREVLAKPGIILIGLLGKNGTTIVKPTMWLEYSNASEQVPPDGGVDPDDERTKDALDQMVEIQRKTQAVAQSVRDDADQGKFNGPEGPPGKSPIIKDRNWWIWDVETQRYIDTGILATGGGGVSSYNDLEDRPRIGGVLLEGNKTAQDLGLQPKGDYATTSSKLANPFSITFTGAVEASYDGSQAVTVTVPTIAGPPGISPTVSTEEIDGGTRVIFTFKGGSETVDILNGKTPVKGTDYFTEAEKQEIAEQAAELVPGGGGPEVWEDIGTVPLSSDVSLYELAGVDDFRKIRLIILRKYNAELTGSMSARILTSKGVLSSILGNFSSGGRAMCNVSIGVDNIGVTGGEVYSVNNLLSTATPAKFISKGPGFGGSANYNRLEGDKYVLYAQQPEMSFDGTEIARLQGVRR